MGNGRTAQKALDRKRAKKAAQQQERKAQRAQRKGYRAGDRGRVI